MKLQKRYILAIGDKIVDCAYSKNTLLPEYNKALINFNRQDGRWGDKPSIWELVKEPKEKS